MMSKTTFESVDSLLLSPKENKLVVQTLGKNKKSLATGVAQVYLALPSDRTQWTKIGTGVVCLVKDKQEKSFFIRMLDIKVLDSSGKEKCVVWEQELYKQFKYRAVSKYFQTFFAHDCRAGINFSSAEEAALFRAAVMERVNVFKQKREEMRERKMAAYLQQHQMNFQLSQLAMQSPFYRMPFRPQNLDPRIQSLLFLQMRSPSVASSQRAQLQAMFNSMSPETRQAFLMSLNNAHSKTGQPNVPEVSSEQQQTNFPQAQMTSQIQQMSAEEPQMSTTYNIEEMTTPDASSGLPGFKAGPSFPQPPPPPPPPTLVPPPPTPSSSSQEKKPVTTSSSSNRSGLLESIQAGTKLRKVEESNSRRKIPKVESGMRGALARALDSRARVLGDEDSDDDDEWDDDDDDYWSD